MVKDGFLEFDGMVETFINDKATVRVNENYTVICTINGKMRQSGIKILPNDMVKIEVSAYDLSKGRITYRMK